MGVRRVIRRIFGTDDARGAKPRPVRVGSPEARLLEQGGRDEPSPGAGAGPEDASLDRAFGGVDKDGSEGAQQSGVTIGEAAALLGPAKPPQAEPEASGVAIVDSLDPLSAPVSQAAGADAIAAGPAPDGGELEAQAEPHTARKRHPLPAGRRGMFRTKVDLTATLETGGVEVPVRIENISGSGAAIIFNSLDPPAAEGNWLDLALPNRAKPLELEVKVVHARQFTNSNGDPLQMLHITFPSIRRGEQDKIISYINNLRLYEGKQYAVGAIVKMEVVTGRRRFAKFTGQTVEIRPDKMKLVMDDFDGIVGAEVMLTIMAPHFADHIDVDDVIIEKVEVVSPRKAEVEVSLKKPDDKILLFVRKHYPPGSSKRQ